MGEHFRLEWIDKFEARHAVAFMSFAALAKRLSFEASKDMWACTAKCGETVILQYHRAGVDRVEETGRVEF